MSYSPGDNILAYNSSDCCGANVTLAYTCVDCGEHCMVVLYDELSPCCLQPVLDVYGSSKACSYCHTEIKPLSIFDIIKGEKYVNFRKI